MRTLLCWMLITLWSFVLADPVVQVGRDPAPAMFGEWVMSNSHSAELMEAWKNGPMSLTKFLVGEASTEALVAIAKGWQDKHRLAVSDDLEGKQFGYLAVRNGFITSYLIEFYCKHERNSSKMNPALSEFVIYAGAGLALLCPNSYCYHRSFYIDDNSRLVLCVTHASFLGFCRWQDCLGTRVALEICNLAGAEADTAKDLFFTDMMGYKGQWEVGEHNIRPNDSGDEEDLSINVGDIDVASDDDENSDGTDLFDTSLAEFE